MCRVGVIGRLQWVSLRAAVPHSSVAEDGTLDREAVGAQYGRDGYEAHEHGGRFMRVGRSAQHGAETFRKYLNVQARLWAIAAADEFNPSRAKPQRRARLRSSGLDRVDRHRHIRFRAGGRE